MLSRIRLFAVAALCLSTFLVSSAIANDGTTSHDGKVPWKMTVVILDGVEQWRQAEIPVKEATEFIEARTRLKFEVEYVNEFSYHELTPYAVGEDYDGDGKGDEGAYLFMAWNLPEPVIQSFPLSDSYLFLYRMNGYRPLQAGSAVGLEYGLWKGGKHRPYATVPTDQWWYVNEPHEGFESRAAQILTHEIVNTIQAKIEAPPYNCGQLTAKFGLPGAEFESGRLQKLNDACYEKLIKNAN